MAATQSPIPLETVQEWLDETGMIAFMGIRAERYDADAQALTLSMPMRDELQGGAAAGHMHGGAIGAFIDTAATFVFLAAGVDRCPTANFRTDMFRPVVDSGLRAVATIRRQGRTLGVSDVDVFDKNDKLVAIGRATFAIYND
ncbi:MAG: PaaI family thioesterase [Pseudomonadota bacterium]